MKKEKINFLKNSQVKNYRILLRIKTSKFYNLIHSYITEHIHDINLKRIRERLEKNTPKKLDLAIFLYFQDIENL